MELNCKPGQLATVVRLSHFLGCERTALGAVVKVQAEAIPQDFYDALLEAYDGQLWHLESPVHCKACGRRMWRLPDRVLRPFDEGSAPDEKEAEEGRPMLSGARALLGQGTG